MGGHPKIKVQFLCGEEIAMGPGKADLLEAIDREGSISGGARAMGMSYRRAWLLVDTMNRCFTRPLVATLPGGGRESGAHVTAEGLAVLSQYRALQNCLAAAAVNEESAALVGALRRKPRKASVGKG